MTAQDRDRPWMVVEDLPSRTPEASDAASAEAPPHEPARPMLIVETLDSAELARPEPEPPPRPPLPPEPTSPAKRSWLAWSLVLGVAGVALIGTMDWALGLIERLPLLGLPAALALAALVVGIVGLVWHEALAMRRLREVERVRGAWRQADGDALRGLIRQVGDDVGDPARARRAADQVEEQGPEAARRIFSREVLHTRDTQAAEAIATAARQGFVMVAASPSPALDALLLIARAVRLLRDVAVIYGYRPGALALRSLALAAGRDAAAVAVADAMAQAVAESASRELDRVGTAMTSAGLAATATGAGAIIGVPIAASGVMLSLFGRSVGATGGPIGGGGVAAWRLYRFGILALIASRPLPFDQQELDEIKARARAEILRISGGRELGEQAATTT
jgi:putative membrane protein